jgi:hypothetical protein
MHPSLTPSMSSMHHVGSGSDVAASKAEERDGPGGSGGGDAGTSPSLTIAWLGMATDAFFGALRADSLGSTLWTIALSSRKYRGGWATRLKTYHRDRRTLPLTLPPPEEQDNLTRAFGEL